MTTFSISDLYASRYLKSSDVGDTDMVKTMSRVEVEELGYGEPRDEKAVVYFSETDKVLPLNKTNATTISRLFGDDTAEWQGKRIALYTTEVSFQGNPMLGIRVRLRPPGQAPGSSQVDAKPPELGF